MIYRERKLISLRSKATLDEVIIRRNGQNWRKASEPYQTYEASRKGLQKVKEKAAANEDNKFVASLIQVYKEIGLS